MAERVAVLVGTLDTKGVEYAYVRECLAEHGVASILVDGGVLGSPAIVADISREEVARAGGGELAELAATADRGHASRIMAAGAREVVLRLFAEGRVGGVLGLGGSGGTTLATAAMRALPLGVPKVMLSTVAALDPRPYVGASDIAMIHSVVDIAGVNRISAPILSNAAAALAGMLQAGPLSEVPDGRPIVGLSMLGVTTTAGTRAREVLERLGYEVLTFHATGIGGDCMERLMREGLIDGVLDLTTVELSDTRFGGFGASAPERLEAAAERGLPQVVVPGGLDMVKFGPPTTVPPRYARRVTHAHNAAVTLVRVDASESAELGRILAGKLNQATGPISVLLPLHGLSALDADGQPFRDPAADAALFDALTDALRPDIDVRELPLHINDPAFAEAAAQRLHALLDSHHRKDR